MDDDVLVMLEAPVVLVLNVCIMYHDISFTAVCYRILYWVTMVR